MISMPYLTPRGLNQVPPFVGVNLYETDLVLQECVAREDAGWAGNEISKFGATAGSAYALQLARIANESEPQLVRQKDRGDANSIVEYAPAYHELMTISMKHGLHCSTWDHMVKDQPPKQGAHVARAAIFYMAAQMEAGHCCPITMTHAAVAALQSEPNLLEVWLPKVLSRTYDPIFAPAKEKNSVTIGMGMTEIQGGTDVNANITKAEPVSLGESGREYVVRGHKFFMSAPMCDAYLVLAQTPGGLSCFLMPQFRPDGSVNALQFLKLKDKLGNRSNASSEVEFHDAFAWLIGDEGEGVRNILQMVTLTRLDCAVSSAGLMRFGLAHAIHHCRHRKAFGKALFDHPLMQRVLCDMALHIEAATRLVMRLAHSYGGNDDETERAWRRLMTPVAKYWVCKTAPVFACEAMECLGGNGYVENMSPLARIYREVPVNAIWEGSGNVMCLDVLRVVLRHPETLELVLGDLAEGMGNNTILHRHLEQIKKLVSNKDDLESNARAFAELLGELAAGVLMLMAAPDEVSVGYLERFCPENRGTLLGGTPMTGHELTILERTLPSE
jgi:putative acyl-CoA dehydrogenase